MMTEEQGGELVRKAWVAWAEQQPDPKPSWLVPWADLDEQSKSADRAIFAAIRDVYQPRIDMLQAIGPEWIYDNY